MEEDRRRRAVAVEARGAEQLEGVGQGPLGLDRVAVGERRQPQPQRVQEDLLVVALRVRAELLAGRREVVGVVGPDRGLVARRGVTAAEHGEGQGGHRDPTSARAVSHRFAP